MYRLHNFTLLCLIAFTAAAEGRNWEMRQKMNAQSPRHYLCYKTNETIMIDGKMEDPAWEKAAWTQQFVDIEGLDKPAPTYPTQAKMLWDDEYFYIAAKLTEPHVWGTITERDAVIFQDNDFEIFIDPDGDGHNYYEFEMNAYNTVWDLLMLWPYHIGRGPNHVFNWNNPGLLTGVHISGTINDPNDTDEYWSVEIAFPWSALRELAPKRQAPASGDQWRVNFSRVDWHMNVLGGRYVKEKDPQTGKNLPPENWVWSPTGRIDMHRPETWAYVQFSDNPVDAQQESFRVDQEERLKWALWQLYYQQQTFYEKYGNYSEDPAHFTLPYAPDQTIQYQFYAGSKTFEITAGEKRESTWHIDHTGRVWKKESLVD